MSRFGWMYANSAMSGAVANGPTNSIQINSGSQVLTGTSNFTYNPVTNTVTLAGVMTGSSLVISASVISASTYLGIVGGGSTTPGGANRAVQFNSGSTLSGSSNLTYDYTNGILSGTIALFSTITGSNISGNVARFNTLSSSNAIVTNTTTVGNYIQLLPVTNPTIPTNTTASYIYTSGSTNDMYFSQYGGGFTNTTRLRWLEGGLSTGLLHGGVLSTVTGTTTFNLSSGSGIVVTYNASVGNDPYPTIKYVTWSNFVSQSLIYSGSAETTYIAIDDLGAISQTNVGFTAAQFKDRIVIGRILHQSASVTNGAITTPTTAYAVASNTQDFFRAFGPLKVSGHFLAASGSTLSITKTTGDSYVEGRNYTLDPNQPNYITSANDFAITTTKIYREYISGSTVVIDSGIANAGYTTIDNQNYNVNGTITAIGSPDKTKFQIQRVYWFPKSTTKSLYVYYGNTLYSTISDAVDGIASETFTEGDNTRTSAIYVGSIIVNKDCTSLADTTTSKIVQGGISRGSSAGGGGGGSSTTNPGGSNHQIQFNDSGVFNGSANLTFDTSTFTVTGTMNVSGTINLIGTAGITTITGSTVTGSTALFTTITGSAFSGGSFRGTTVSGTAAQFTSITASAYSSSGDIQTGGGLTAFGNVATQGNVQAQGAIAGRYRTFAGNFTVATNSWFCAINSSGAAVTASLGLANTYYPGQQITFKDVGGFAAVSGKGILIQASGSDKIDGASSLVISATSGSVTVISDGSGSFYITSIV